MAVARRSRAASMASRAVRKCVRWRRKVVSVSNVAMNKREEEEKVMWES